MSNAASLGAQRCQRQHIARVRLDAAIDHCLRPVRTGGEHRAPRAAEQVRPSLLRKLNAVALQAIPGWKRSSPAALRPGALPQILP